MNIDTLVIIVSSVSLIVGIFIGIQLFKSYDKKQDKKIIENAEEVLSGKRDNKIKIDGEEFNATKFRVRDEEDKEIIIDLQGGGTEQNGTRQKDSPGAEEIPEQDVETTGENSSSNRKLMRDSTEKKRNPRTRRARRFG